MINCSRLTLIPTYPMWILVEKSKKINFGYKLPDQVGLHFQIKSQNQCIFSILYIIISPLQRKIYHTEENHGLNYCNYINIFPWNQLMAQYRPDIERRTLYCFLTSDTSGEYRFLRLKYIKNYLMPTTSQEKTDIGENKQQKNFTSKRTKCITVLHLF